MQHQLQPDLFMHNKIIKKATLFYVLFVLIALLRITSVSAQTIPIYPDKTGIINSVIWTEENNPLLIYPYSSYIITARPIINAWKVTGQYAGPVALTLYTGKTKQIYLVTNDICYTCDINSDGEVNLLDFAELSSCWLWQDVLR